MGGRDAGATQSQATEGERMRDGDGNRIFVGGRYPHAAILDSEGVHMRSGYRGLTRMPESRRAVLRYLIEHPGKTANQCAKALDLASVESRVSDFAAIGYVEFCSRDRLMGNRKLRVTPKGVQAYERENISHSPVELKYETYQPPKSFVARKGAEDALSIKSKGNA